jgi:hypothetical protein
MTVMRLHLPRAFLGAHAGEWSKDDAMREFIQTDYFQAIRSRALEWTVRPENFSSIVSNRGHSNRTP